MPALSDEARAKVNLTLQVNGRRADGFHDLESVVAFADCADRLTLTPGSNLDLTMLGTLAQVCGAAGAEQDHVDAGLMPGEAVGRVDDVLSSTGVQQEPQRVAGVDGALLELALGDKIPNGGLQQAGLAEDVAYGKHAQGADAIRTRAFQHRLTRVLVQHVEGQHDDLPHALFGGAFEHLVLGIPRPSF